MRIADILRSKGQAVATVTETTTVAALLTELEVRNIGAMVVIGTGGQERSDSGNMSTGGVVGIVSERDIVRKLHKYGPELLGRSVGDIMSVDVVTCRPDDPIDDLAALMTNNRVRHVPVLDNGRLAGIVSIGDVVKHRMEEMAAQHQQLQAYITQGAS